MKKRYALLVVLLPLAVVTALGFPNKDDKSNIIAGQDFEYEAASYDVPLLEDMTYEFPNGFNSPEVGKSYTGFKEALAFSESTSNYFAVNRLGYKGRYQFGNSTLKWVGINNPKEFLKSPLLQERAFDALVAKNKYVLRDYITTYAGKTIGGVEITESGLIAAAHLCGAGNVKKFLDTAGKYVFSDGNNVPVTAYLSRFNDYDTSVVAADASARAYL